MKLQIYATTAAVVIAATCLLLPNLHLQGAQASSCGWCFSNGQPVSAWCSAHCSGYQQQATTQQVDWPGGGLEGQYWAVG
jgi:hypothetical protein